MAAPAELTGEPVPEPTEPVPPGPDPAGESAAARDENALAVAEIELAPASSASDPEPAPAPSASDPELAPAPPVSGPEPAPSSPASDPELAPAPPASGPEPAPSSPASDPELAPAPPASDPGQARGMSRLAVAAVIFGLIVVAGVAVGALAIATHGFRPKNVIHYRLAAVFSLRPGDCINSAPNGLSVTVLSCGKPHDAEVFAAFPLSASSWPGTAAVQSQASDGCTSRIAGYLNPQLANAGLAQEYFYPNEEAWRAGVRTVVCEISSPSGQLTGSVRGPS
jgi:hypothetical protein